MLATLYGVAGRASVLLAAEEVPATEGNAEPTEKGLEVLPDVDELLWGSLFFALLLVALVKFVFPRLRAALEERTRRIQGQLEQAERTRRDADQVMEQYRAQLAEARTEAQRIVDDGRRTAESVRQEIIAKAEREAQAIVQRAQQDVAGERDRAMASLRSTLGDLSIQLASRVIERELSSSQAHRDLVDRAIAELSRSGATGSDGASLTGTATSPPPPAPPAPPGGEPGTGVEPATGGDGHGERDRTGEAGGDSWTGGNGDVAPQQP